MGNASRVSEIIGKDFGRSLGTSRRAPPVLSGQPVGEVSTGLTETLKAARFPSRYLNARLGKFEINTPDRKRALKSVLNWVNGKRLGRWLYIHGPVGTGKSHLAHAVLAEMIAGDNSGGNFLSVDWLSLCTELKSKANYGMNAEQTLRDIGKAKILLIDDFGKSLTPWNLELGFLVLNRRYNEQQATILTSNDKLSAIRAKPSPGDAVADRIAEMGSFIELAGRSRREVGTCRRA